jgi:DNA-directed RNA polymerase subunit RPC12/RpoP
MNKSNETSKRQIKAELTACIFALDNGPDMCGVEEQQIIFNEMQCCINKIMHLNNRLKGPVEVVENKAKKKPIDRPTLDEVNDYLKSHYTDEHCYNTLMAPSHSGSADRAECDLKDIAQQLKDTNDRAEGSILQVYYILGSQLSSAKARFKKMSNVKKWSSEWSQWVKENVGLSTSHCNKIVAVADLLTRFPKLRNLKGVSFTKIYNLRKEIIQLFSNEDIAINWPDELCVICYTKPRVTSGFISCKHGTHYCNACITELMKERRTEIQVILDDGQVDRFMKKIPGAKCPECRTKIVLPPKPATHNYNLRPRRK